MIFARFRQIGRAVGQAQRFRAIAAVALRYGYDDVAVHLPLPRFWLWLRTRQFRKVQEEIVLMSRPERLRCAFEELGPAFVKLGQLLASRTRILPRAYTDELAKLNDHVPPVPFAEIEAILVKELRQPTSVAFAQIDPEPLGSASIAQVYKATLAAGGEVVIKVQRPDIARVVHTDLEIMVHMAELLERNIEEWQPHHPSAIVEEFARRIELELDFSAEIAGMERFARQFEGDPTVYVPRVQRSLSTRRVLTMERIDGIPAAQLTALDAAGLDRAEIARRIGDLTLRQIFTHGFFHGDPHPGNVHILPGNIICYLDFGLTGFLTHEMRDTLAALLVAVAQKNERAGTVALLRLSGAELDPPHPGLESDMADFIHRHFSGTVRELVFVRLLQHLLQITARHGLTLPPEVFLVIKSLGQIEHLVRELAPDFDLLEQAKPFVGQIHANHLHPRRVLREVLLGSSEAAMALRTLPLELRRVAAQVHDGKARINFRLDGLRPLNDTVERATNRLAVAVVLGALIVASALVIHANVPPQFHGVSIIGLIGYCFAGLMGAALLFSIIRHGRM